MGYQILNNTEPYQLIFDTALEPSCMLRNLLILEQSGINELIYETVISQLTAYYIYKELNGQIF